MSQTAPHLWECEHAYYSNESNYYSNECSWSYGSWAEFTEQMGGSDMDLNLLVRWDWRDRAEGDELFLVWIHQRKGKYVTTTVHVRKEDEPAIRDWLRVRLQHLRSLWAPVDPTGVDLAALADEPTYDDPPVAKEGPAQLGTCDCCGSEKVKLNRHHHDGMGGTTKSRVWAFCDFCYRSNASNSVIYGRESGDILQDLANGVNTILKRLEEVAGPEGCEVAIDGIVEKLFPAWEPAIARAREYVDFSHDYGDKFEAGVLAALADRRPQLQSEVIQRVQPNMESMVRGAVSALLHEGKIKLVGNGEHP